MFSFYAISTMSYVVIKSEIWYFQGFQLTQWKALKGIGPTCVEQRTVSARCSSGTNYAVATRCLQDHGNSTLRPKNTNPPWPIVHELSKFFLHQTGSTPPKLIRSGS